VPDTLDPRRTALLVMDYQNGVTSRFPDTEAPVARTAEAISLVRRLGGTIGYVRVGLSDDDWAAMPATSPFATMLDPSRRAGLLPDSPHTAIDERVAPEPGDLIVRKSRVGAFSTTDLDRRLRDAGIDTLVLAGISTSGVVLSTLRDGADRDYRLVVLSDACTDPAPGVHDFLVGQIFPRQARVVTTAELPALLA
jgi:nicotinamidase-related amidase